TIDWTVPKCEIGYWIRSSCARRGYATEAATALAALASGALGARRVEITCNARNAASRRVAEKSGFALEAVLANHRRDTAGALAPTRGPADACDPHPRHRSGPRRHGLRRAGEGSLDAFIRGERADPLKRSRTARRAPRDDPRRSFGGDRELPSA